MQSKYKGSDLAVMLRQVIDDSGMTRYAIAQRSGVLQSSLSRAYNGQTDTTYDLLRSVCDGVGLDIFVEICKPTNKKE